MTPETLTALKASIDHWTKNVQKPDEASVDDTDCALCMMFNTEDSFATCGACPVMGHTGKTLCGGTPYVAARDALALVEDAKVGGNPEAIESMQTLFIIEAAREIVFLQSLLPEEE